MVAEESCDLLVTAVDARTQSVRLTMVPNPSPTYACCGSPQVPQPGMWVALDPIVLSPSSVVVSFSSSDGGAKIDGGGAMPDGGTGGVMDAHAIEVDPYPWSITDADPKHDLYTPTPTDEQSCVQATGVLPCEAGGTTMLIRAATPGTLFIKAEVTSGSCGVAGSVCYGGCESLTIFQGLAQSLGSTCDLLVTFWGGGEQTVHLELVANPSPSYMCCGYPLPPNPGRWIALDPLLFSPSQIFLSSPVDGGPGGIDAPRFYDGPPGPEVPRLSDAAPP
jgi:hypothetical protein